jgi:hypothetical protein
MVQFGLDPGNLCTGWEASIVVIKFDEPLTNKIEMIKWGNAKSFNSYPDIVKKTINKEDQCSHL